MDGVAATVSSHLPESKARAVRWFLPWKWTHRRLTGRAWGTGGPQVGGAVSGWALANLSLASWGPQPGISPRWLRELLKETVDQRARLPPNGGTGQNGPLVECLLDTK